MLEDGVHGVARLLAGDPQVLLERSGYRREDGLGRLVRVQGTGGTCNVSYYFVVNKIMECILYYVLFRSDLSSDLYLRLQHDNIMLGNI